MKIIFLIGNLKEEVYIDQLKGFLVEWKEHIVCKRKKSIYRLQQAFRWWYLKFNDIIIFFKFKNIVDHYIYLKVNERKFIFLILYVDNILLTINDIGLLHETKKFLSNNFEIKDMGEIMIGIEIIQDKSQELLGLP